MCFARIQCTCCLCLPGVYSMARFLHGSCQLFFTFPFVVWWWWSFGILWGRGTAQSLIAIHMCKCWRHHAPSHIRRHCGCGHFSAQIRHVRPLSAPCFCIQSIEAKGETFPFHQHPCYHSACSQVIRQTGIHLQQMRYTSHGFLPCIKFWLGPEDIPGAPKHTSQGWQQSSTLRLSACPCL